MSGLERPRYFAGKILTADDFALEQRYQTEKNSLDYRWWSCMNIRPTDWERAAAFGDLFDVEMMPHYQDGGSSDHGHTP